MMLAVRRAFGKSDYIPCIAWGRNAQYAARFHVGDQLRLTGRLQSREYQKLLESGEYLTRNAYEVSAFTLDAPDAAPDFSTQPVDARLAFERAHAQQAEDAGIHLTEKPVTMAINEVAEGKLDANYFNQSAVEE